MEQKAGEPFALRLKGGAAEKAGGENEETGVLELHLGISSDSLLYFLVFNGREL